MLTRILKPEILHGHLKNTAWLLGERVLRMLVNLVIGAYIARYLGPADYGALSYASSFAGLFVVFVLLGLPRILVRELVRAPERSGELLGSAFALMALGGLAVIAILAALVPMLDISPVERWMILIIGAGLVFQSVNVIDVYFQSIVQSRYVVQAQSVQLAVSTAVKLCLIWYQADLVWFAAVTTFDSMVLACALLVIYRARRGHAGKWTFRLETAATLMNNAWPLILSLIAVTVYMKIDQVMIRAMLGADAVGQYSAAVRISEAWYFIPVAITSSVFPSIIKAREGEASAYQDKLQSLLNLMVWLAVGVAIPVTFLSDRIIDLLFGSAYNEAAAILTIHIWAAVFVFINNALQQWYIAEGLEKLAAARTGLGLFANIVLNYLLIPHYGAIGAAWATLVSRMLVGFLLNFIFTETRPMFWMIVRSMALGFPPGKHD